MSESVSLRQIMIGGNNPGQTPIQQPTSPPPSTPGPQKPKPTHQPKSNRPIPINQVSGNVSSYQDNIDNHSKASRWFGSLVGKAYSRNGHYALIQITNPNNPNTLIQVKVYGELGNGAIVNGNKITAYGKFDKTGQFIATSIHNDTTGADVRPVDVIPRVIIFAVTIAFLLLIAILITLCFTIKFNIVTLALIVIIVMLFIRIKISHLIRGRR